MRRRAVAASALSAALLLQGCAAAIIPAIAASTIAKRQAAGAKRPGAARTLIPPAARGAAAGTAGTRLPLTALPAPTFAAVDPTMRFVNHALMTAATGATPGHSMVLSPASTLEAAAFMPCEPGQPLAVAIDAGLASAPRLTEALRRLRAFDVEVLWIADPGEVDALRATLKANGAWARGDAPILTTGPGAERKELVRQEATRAFCIVAVAGAGRGDVAELYGFLRDPNAAFELEKFWGAGWFLVPKG